MKLSLISTIHVKQKHNIGFFIFKFTLKYMLGNVYINKVYINKIHARQCLYACLFCREGIVPKRVSTPLLLGSPPLLKIPHLPTLPANLSSQVFFISRNITEKLSSINTIHVK